MKGKIQRPRAQELLERMEGHVQFSSVQSLSHVRLFVTP